MSLRTTYDQPEADRYLRPGGPWDVPTLDRLLRATQRSSDTAVADSSRRLSGTAVARAVATLAGGLRSAGVRPGDTVMWQLPNGIEAWLLFRACWRLGAIAVPVHHLAGAGDLPGMLATVEPRLLVSGGGLPMASMPGAIVAGPEHVRWRELSAGAPVARSPARGSDVAVVLFTSGSTGEPKAVLHTHRSLSYKTGAMIGAHGLVASDAVLMPAPLAHISGLLSGLLLPAAVGMKVVLMERWDPDRAVDLVSRERVTFMIGPPAYFTAMADAAGFSSSAVSSLRIISLGSTTINPDFVDTTRSLFHAVVKRTYGSTEAPTVTTSRWDDPPDRARDTDGRVVTEARMRLVDPSTGRTGGHGELQLQGPELFAGYADSRQTRASTQGGWFSTGDLATIDEDGWLTIVGRLKELIIRGGENVVPAEVERLLERHPDIHQAVVVGYPDERLGERVAACVVASGAFGLERCRSWFSELGVARYKTPDRVHRLAEIPLLGLGKPDRAAVRAAVTAMVPEP